MKRNVVSVLVQNHPGVLFRISALFSRRGYNINSITASPTQDANLSRITVLCTGDESIVEQMMKQLSKQEDVKKVLLLKEDASTLCDIALVKLYVKKGQRRAMMDAIYSVDGKIIDMGETTVTVEITGSYDHVDGSLSKLYQFDVAEVARTGLVGLQHGDNRLVDFEG